MVQRFYFFYFMSIYSFVKICSGFLTLISFCNDASVTASPKYIFKTPTLRNTGLTAPYMHNGFYKTLNEVMRFYNMGGGKGIGIDLANQTLPPDTLGLTQVEILTLRCSCK